MKQRQGYTFFISEEAEQRMKNDQCPACGLPKEKWTRRTDWRCCSAECSQKYYSEFGFKSWADIRRDAFERDKYTCAHCGTIKIAEDLIGDHIKPISLGGDEFAIENVQTLCIPCDKIKTKADMKDIAVGRLREKLIAKGQVFLK